MNEQMQKITDFLKYKVTNQNASDTDKVAWMFTVEKPELLNKAIKAVFPDPTDQPGNEAVERLREFIKEHLLVFHEADIQLDTEAVDYTTIFVAFFL
ncbi:hypothetical protein DFO77_10760 [Marinilabilia salmonicolor]|uniref:Uncharacterized protein n=2 Tax=Marinilabilia salmonicolor TaxID=989 RepID=A0A368V6Q3_9BACT|nr:hypothetical protein DFO77_10760 [Marinilabilia salmonicolor]